MRSAIRGVLFVAVLFGVGTPASAIPLLQLDIANGVYDPVTQTILATTDPFTVSAILTPTTNASASEIQALLSDTYYVSIAVTPQVGPTGVDLGSFTFNGSTVNVTSDMTYGNPPLETLATLQGFDPGDLSSHGIFPTYYYQIPGFHFDAATKTTAYNTADNPGGLTPNAAGTAYYYSFLINTANLDPRVELHFDLYNEKIATCAKNNNCTSGDVDVNNFAPYSHDAQSGGTRVPEPSSSLLLMIPCLGLLAAGMRRRLLA
jgi:hypothetical protein